MREPKKSRYTNEQFKTAFQVGDFVCGWGTGKVVRITALGKQNRFLAENCYNRESVHTMNAWTGWAKVPRPIYWPEDPKK